MNAIEVHNLHKVFRIPHERRDTVREQLFGIFRAAPIDELRVLDGISFSVPPGGSFGLMGRNGCGKSTLLKMLAGIYQPDGGEVRIHGAVTAILSLGLGWNSELTAVDNVLLTGTAMGLTLAEVEEQLDEILAFAELERFRDLPLKFFSSGMSARLAYSVAFKAVREILLLDEIFAVGDASFSARCKARYRELHEDGRTVVLVSHDPKVISEQCEKAILIENGRALVAGTGSEVAEAYLRLLKGQSANLEVVVRP